MKTIIYLITITTALGGLVFGFDSGEEILGSGIVLQVLKLMFAGIIATTFGHESFRVTMYGPSQVNAPLTGAIVSLYNVGQALGGPMVGYLADKYSRKYTISLAALICKCLSR